MASFALCDQMPDDNEARKAVALIARNLPDEVEELVNCGFLRREDNDYFITEKGCVYAEEQVNKVMALEAPRSSSLGARPMGCTRPSTSTR